MRPRRRQPTKLPRPWESPGKNTGVGCHFLLQCMKVKSESEVAQSCPTLCDRMDCSLPGSSVHGNFQARVLEWVAIAFSVAISKLWRIRGSNIFSFVRIIIIYVFQIYWKSEEGKERKRNERDKRFRKKAKQSIFCDMTAVFW